MSDIYSININSLPAPLKPNEYFLDNVKGDLYSYNYETNEWIHKANIGLHSKKAAKEIQTLGKFNLHVPQKKANEQKGMRTGDMLKSKPSDVVCRIRKGFSNHWALKNLPSEFFVDLETDWEIHAKGKENIMKPFDIVAESDKSPMIIVFDSILATQFEVIKK
jgi:hypothetical protein